eukprot:354068-Chlamydomonas_euryale.AAC.5
MRAAGLRVVLLRQRGGCWGCKGWAEGGQTKSDPACLARRSERHEMMRNTNAGKRLAHKRAFSNAMSMCCMEGALPSTCFYLLPKLQGSLDLPPRSRGPCPACAWLMSTVRLS